MRLTTIASLCTALVACGGGGSSGGTPAENRGQSVANADSWPRGVVVLAEQRDKWIIDAWFTTDAEPERTMETVWQQGEEHCSMDSQTHSSAASQSASMSDLNTSGMGTLAAGEALTFRSRAGIYALLEQQSVGSTTVYASEVRWFSEPPPEDLLLEVPGTGVFPAAPSISITPIQPLVFVSPESGILDESDSPIQWEAGAQAGSRIELTLNVSGDGDGDGDGENASDTTGTLMRIDCSVSDDGQFELPLSVRNRLPDSLAGLHVSLLRTRSDVHALDQASLTIAQTSAP